MSPDETLTPAARSETIIVPGDPGSADGRAVSRSRSSAATARPIRRHGRIRGVVELVKPALPFGRLVLSEQMPGQPAEGARGHERHGQEYQHELARRTEPIAKRHGRRP